MKSQGIFVIIVIILLSYVIYINNKNNVDMSLINTNHLSNDIEEDNTIPLTDKEKMFNKYFPPVDNEIRMDYPLKPIGCCPPSKELSKDLPIGNIPICYAKNSKSYLK
jgi:hypothetical protein